MRGITRAAVAAIVHLADVLTASGDFDDLAVPTVVPADPEHPGPVRYTDGTGYCCWANYMVSPETHNADCNAAKGTT